MLYYYLDGGCGAWLIPGKYSLPVSGNATGRTAGVPFVAELQHYRWIGVNNGIAKKVLCFTWFLGTIATANILTVVSLVTNVVCRLRILNNK